LTSRVAKSQSFFSGETKSGLGKNNYYAIRKYLKQISYLFNKIYCTTKAFLFGMVCQCVKKNTINTKNTSDLKKVLKI